MYRNNGMPMYAIHQPELFLAIYQQKSSTSQKDQTVQSLSSIMMQEEPELIADYACETGENPLWHPLEGKLYWTDIPMGRIFRYDPTTGTHEQCYKGRPVGGFTIQPDGALLLFMVRGTIALWRDGELTEVVHDIPAERASRFNDVIADPRGRVFCGTMSTPEQKGRLYRLETDSSLHIVLEDIACSNGMAFTLDRRSFLYTDSEAYKIYLFDYNEENGALTNQRVFAEFPKVDGLPDGMTLDRNGQIWSAFWDGSCISRLDSSGIVAHHISLPVRKVSSLTFGGDDYTDIYITTAGGHTRHEDGPLAGGLFRLRNQGPGIPEFFSRVAT